MGALVCTIGTVRGGELAQRTMRQHLLHPTGADLAMLVGDDERPMAEALHVWRMREPAAWADVLDRRLGGGWRHNVTLRPNIWGGIDGLPGSGAIIFALRLVLLDYLDALRDGGYRTVTLTRTDLAYACDHPPIRPSVGEVWVQRGEECFGVSDRHTVFHYEDRHRVLRVLPWLAAHGRRGWRNPEPALLAYYRASDLRVRKFSRVNFAVRHVDDHTRWQRGVTPCGINYTVKYDGAHDGARRTCGRTPCDVA